MAKKKELAIEKLPPNVSEIEGAVLGLIISESEYYYQVNSFLKEKHFYKEEHQYIYKAIEDLAKEQKPIDVMTITQQLHKNKHLEIVGGAFTVSSLTDKTSTPANVEYHARVIVEKYLKRELILISTKSIQRAYEDIDDCFEILDNSKQEIDNIENEVFSSGEFKTIESVGDKWLQDLEKKRSGIFEDGLKSGFEHLYDFINSDLIIIGARPGMGKTAFILSIIRKIIEQKVPTGMFSIEMSILQILTRIASGECQIDSENLRDGKISNEEINQLHAKIQELKKAKLYIDDTASIDIDVLCAKARKMKRKKDIKILFIDYLGLITTTLYKNDKTNQIGYISRRLKALARELNIPIVCLAQLSRKIEERKPGERMPNLSDLRDSGDIEQDADQVMFIYRPQYYGLDTYFLNGQEFDIKGKALVKYAKNRHGSLKVNMFKFIGKFTEFKDDYTLEPTQTKIDENEQPIF